MPGIASVNLTIPHEIAFMKSHYKAKLVAKTSIRLASGYAGKMLTFNGTEDGVKIVIREILVAKGHNGYFIEMFGRTEASKADGALFKRIYATWRPTR